MKNEGQKRVSLPLKVVIMAIAAVLSTAAVLVYSYSQQMATVADVELDKRAGAIITGLASECEYALIVGNKSLVERAVVKVLGQSDVASAVVFDDKGKVMAAAGHVDGIAKSKEGPGLVAKYKGTAVTELHKGAPDISEVYYLPVYLQPASASDGMGIDDSPSDKAREVGRRLGLVELTVDMSSMNRALQQAREMALLIASLLAVVVSTLCILAVRRLVRPLRRLVDGTGALAGGDLSVRVPVTSADELGDVAQAFNEMAWSLQRSQAEVLDYQRNLQQHVHERTAALEKEIAERKKAEQELQDAKSRLENVLEELKSAQLHVVQQERLRALGEMASGIAHDFNNALAPIQGFSEMLLEQPQLRNDRNKLEEYLQIVHTASRDAANTVGRLREFYRTRDEKELMKRIDLRELVRQAFSLTQPRWKDQAAARGVQIQVEADMGDVSPVLGNEGDLREMLTNLIFNAVDAMPEGGTIRITGREEGGHVVLRVRDTGTGMTEEVRRRCLEPFFTTKGDRGTGLGLSMVFGIVRRHDGTIDVQSELGRGTTFVIRLPVAAKEAEAKDGPAAKALQTGHKRVLIVDDEPMVSKVEARGLEGVGHTVVQAGSGQEGLERFRTEPFDVVVTDRAMPGMSGDQVAAAIKGMSPSTPVIMLTGFGDLMAATGEKPPHVDVVLSKPITLTTLREAVKNLTLTVGEAARV
ncbi:MAG TPA: ATP-binding protein [Verrucomicrobiae bacterium]|nr:ATP-binding protein [Verrucomicrobiae bacterium]